MRAHQTVYDNAPLNVTKRSVSICESKDFKRFASIFSVSEAQNKSLSIAIAPLGKMTPFQSASLVSH